jgi:small-conductance mechanosensitive channel
MRQYLTDFLSNFDSPVLAAVVLFTLYILLAKIADLFTDKVIRRIVKISKSDLDDQIINFVHRPIFFTIIIIGGIHASKYLSLSEKAAFNISGLLLSLLVIIWVICTIKVSKLIIDHTIHKVADITGLSKELTPLVENIWKVIVIASGIMITLSIWKINISPMLASAGIVGVAVALAAKDTLSNFFGGISIFIDKPYKIGDYIVLDSGERGEVVNIGIRSSRIKTRDDILITIPNAIIANTKIINESAPVPKFRIRVPVSTVYGSDVNRVEEVLMKVAVNNNNVQPSPEPRVRFRTFGDSSLNFELLCWAKEPSLRGRTIHELNKEIYRAFNEENITFPFPHRTVYLREEKNWLNQ